MSIRIRSLVAAAILAALPALPQVAGAQVSFGISINIAPPPLPVYVQPPCPAVGYIWTPGYWAWAPTGYYWVPGTWVLPPAVGLLWTPGYWGWEAGAYRWHAGYWGPRVGFYGGVNYGYGYGGSGYEGGFWRGRVFVYNRSVANVAHIHNVQVYNKVVVNNWGGPRVSFNGGAGGIAVRASAADLAFARERHVAFTSFQTQHERSAFQNVSLRASVNGGHPGIAATMRPGEFTGHGVVGARGFGGPGGSGNFGPGGHMEQNRPGGPGMQPGRPGGLGGPQNNHPGGFGAPPAMQPGHPGAMPHMGMQPGRPGGFGGPQNNHPGGFGGAPAMQPGRPGVTPHMGMQPGRPGFGGGAPHMNPGAGMPQMGGRPPGGGPPHMGPGGGGPHMNPGGGMPPGGGAPHGGPGPQQHERGGGGGGREHQHPH